MKDFSLALSSHERALDVIWPAATGRTGPKEEREEGKTSTTMMNSGMCLTQP